MQRRDFLLASAALMGGSALRAEEKAPAGFALGFSLYGMKSLATIDGIKACAEIGYECTELPLMADWPADSAKLTKADIGAIRAAAASHRLPIVALMENLRLAVDDAQHKQNLERLTRACEIAQALAPDKPPLVETVLGGSPQQWDAVKDAMVARLRDWAKVASEAGVKLAIKGHVNNAAQLPRHVVWLLDEVKSPSLCAAYDYSHFQLQGLTLEDSLAALIERTEFIHVKDATGALPKFKFALPGDGDIDYAAYFQLLREHKYAGPVMVEVSGQVSSQPGYDPLAAVRKCWETLSAARKQAS